MKKLLLVALLGLFAVSAYAEPDHHHRRHHRHHHHHHEVAVVVH